jgi:hypothetical protein
MCSVVVAFESRNVCGGSRVTRTHRSASLLATIALVASLAFGAAGCQRKVEVQTGEKVVCVYGHDISNDVRAIEVPADQASKYSVKTRTTTCPDHLKLEATYRAAQEDIAKADLKAAAKKLAAVVAVDSTFKKAQSQLDDINAGKTPQPDNSGSSGGTSTPGTGSKPTTPGDSGTPTGPIASLAAWLPPDIAGYAAQKMSADALYLTRDYWPSSDSGSKRLVISAEQLLDAKAAAAALKANVKVPYGEDDRTLQIKGKSAYVGTDGRHTAVLGLTDGPVIVILQLSSEKDDAADLVDELVAIAKTLPR